MNLQLDQRFSDHAEAVKGLSSLLLGNAVTADFCEDKPAVFFSFITGVTDKSQSSILAVAKILSKSL